MVDSSMINTGSKNVKVNAKTVAAKFKSKREIWNFLTFDADAYLPAEHCVTIYYMKDLLSGKKKSKSLFN